MAVAGALPHCPWEGAEAAEGFLRPFLAMAEGEGAELTAKRAVVVAERTARKAVAERTARKAVAQAVGVPWTS